MRTHWLKIESSRKVLMSRGFIFLFPFGTIELAYIIS